MNVFFLEELKLRNMFEFIKMEIRYSLKIGLSFDVCQMYQLRKK